jgi:regulator of protease activity HflC (stomatin/prohibitin superfamily)
VQSLSVEPPWIVPAALIFFNLLVLLILRRNDKRQVKWSHFFQLVMFDLAAAYVYTTVNAAPLNALRPELWFWVAILPLTIIVLPFVFYWGWLALVSVFLLPIELKHWRQWLLAARAFLSFVRGVNHPYFGYDEKTNELEERFGGNIMTKTGVGIILMRPEHAVVLHSGPKLTRVEGGDVVFTRRLERPLQMVDLRTHVVAVRDVNAVTKDGIGVKLHVFVPCRIDPAGAPSQPERLYPFNPSTVFRVVREQNVAERENRSWPDFVAQKAEKAVRDIISTYVLDRLFVAEDEYGIPRNEIKDRIRDRVKAEMNDAGIEVLGVGMANIEPDERPGSMVQGGEAEEVHLSVTEQRLASWQAEWRRRAAEREARSEAEAIRILEQARAQVFTELIKAVEEGFRELAKDAATPHDVIALSFVNAVEQMLASRDVPVWLGVDDTRSTVQAIRRLMQLSIK